MSTGKKVCEWTDWYDDENGKEIGRNVTHEIEDIDEILEENMDICEFVVDIECRDVDQPSVPFQDIEGQEVCCDLKDGLVCENLYYEGHPCSNYEVRVYCCRYEPCVGETTTQPIQGSTASTVIQTSSPTANPTTLSTVTETTGGKHF